LQTLFRSNQATAQGDGFWDVLLFNIATVLGPRWIAAAAHNGTSSISLWCWRRCFSLFHRIRDYGAIYTIPHEGGLYVWSKEAFGDFHGFVAGWTYWIYRSFIFQDCSWLARRWELISAVVPGDISRKAVSSC